MKNYILLLLLLTGCSSGGLTRRGVTSGETVATPTTVIAAQPESLLPAPVMWMAPTNRIGYVYPQREAARTNAPAIVAGQKFKIFPKHILTTNELKLLTPP